MNLITLYGPSYFCGHGTPLALVVDAPLPHTTATERIPPRLGVIRYDGIAAGSRTSIHENPRTSLGLASSFDGASCIVVGSY